MPWDPTRDLLTMQEQLDSLFGRATTGWVPAADLHETADRYVLALEVPGLTRADVEKGVADYLERFYYEPKSWTEYLDRLGIETLLTATRGGRSIYDD